MKLIPNAASVKFARTLLLMDKHSPTILFAGGVAGVIGTTVLACRATLKLEGVLDDTDRLIASADVALTKHTDKYTEQDYKKDMLLIRTQGYMRIVKLYSPALALGVVSIAALTKSHNILTQRNVALTAAYAAVERSFREYRQAVANEIGEENERVLYVSPEQVETEDSKGKPVKTAVATSLGHSPYARFFDEGSRNWSKTPEYNYMFLRSQQNAANDRLHARGHLFLNEVYDALDIPHSQEGAIVGWVVDNGDNFVDFGMFRADGGARDFVNGREGSILLDFNVDGPIYTLIGK